MSGKKKCFLTLMLVAGMETLLSGCGAGTSVNDTVAQTNDSLTIYVLDTDQSPFLDAHVAEYKKRYPDVEVEIKTIPAEDLENQQKRIAAELMAGDGADLYVDAISLIDDLYKAQETGALEDLMPWFSQMEGFSEEDYVDGTFDLYEHTDACYVFPLDFTGNMVAVRKNMEEELGIDVNTWNDSSDMLDAIELFYGKYPEEQPFLKMEPYRLFFAGYGYDISDGMKNAEILNSSVFQRDMEYYKKQAYPEGTYVGEQSWEAYEAEFEKMLHEEKPYLGKFLYDDLRYYIKMGGEEKADLGMIYGADGAGIAYPFRNFAISSGSQNKRNAFQLLQIIMEMETDNPQLSAPYTNKQITQEFLRQQKDKWMKDEVVIDGEIYAGLTEKTFSKLEEMYMEFFRVTVMQPYPDGMKYMEPYFTGESEMEECIEAFRNYLELYYSE